MLDEQSPGETPDTTATTTTTTAPRTRRRAASRPAGPPAAGVETATGDGNEPAAGAPTAATKRRTTRRAPKAAPPPDAEPAPPQQSAPEQPADSPELAAPAEPAKTSRRRTTKRDADAAASTEAPAADLVFQAPDPLNVPQAEPAVEEGRPEPPDGSGQPGSPPEDDGEATQTSRRRRRRGGRRRRKPEGSESDADATAPTAEPVAEGKPHTGEEPEGEGTGEPSSSSSRRRRRRRRKGEASDAAPDDPTDTVVRVREPRGNETEIAMVEGSTRLEAKKQRRREGREASRRRVPIVSEAEFLARRESVKRSMVVRQRSDVTQIAVIEDDVLAEHYVARESQTSLIGNVYLGRVQNVLPSMEAAFIDIGKGRNGVLYAGEVDWVALGHEGKPRKIEEALKSGQTVMVQVSKDPVAHKGARLTSQLSLPGRFLVYVPGGHTSGISRKLPDTERNRLRDLTKDLLPDDAGVIIRTAAEGATEEQLTRDVAGLTARWDDILAKGKKGQAPQLLYGEPDLMLKVVRDLFTEDFTKLVVDGDDAWDMVQAYVTHVAPDLADRLERWSGEDDQGRDVFSAYRIDEQIAKGLDRKVWLPSGGSLVIDRTEAMTVVDVNTGKFTGSGGNLEETVTKNNLEAAEEIVRQLRLRDIGGIIVIDFIDMVLEGNRDLVLRRLVECLGRDRTRHQVAEVTSLGLVQMTRKRIGTGLLEAFGEPCEHCQGRGVLIHSDPVEVRESRDDGAGRGRRRSGSDVKATSRARKSSAAADGASADEPTPALAGSAS